MTPSSLTTSITKARRVSDFYVDAVPLPEGNAPLSGQHAPNWAEQCTRALESGQSRLDVSMQQGLFEAWEEIFEAILVAGNSVRSVVLGPGLAPVISVDFGKDPISIVEATQVARMCGLQVLGDRVDEFDIQIHAPRLGKTLIAFVPTRAQQCLRRANRKRLVRHFNARKLVMEPLLSLAIRALQGRAATDQTLVLRFPGGAQILDRSASGWSLSAPRGLDDQATLTPATLLQLFPERALPDRGCLLRPWSDAPIDLPGWETLKAGT